MQFDLVYMISVTLERDILELDSKKQKNGEIEQSNMSTKKELLHLKNADQNQNSQKQKPRAKTYYIKEKKQSFFFFFFFFPVQLCRGVTSVQIGATSCCCCRDDAGSFLRKENDRMRGGDDDDDEDDARRRPGLLQHSTTIITFVPRLRAYTLWIKVTTKRLQQVQHMILIPTVSSSQIRCKGDDNNGEGKKKKKKQEDEEESYEISATSQTKSSTAELDLYSTSRRASSGQGTALFASDEELPPRPHPLFTSLVGAVALRSRQRLTDSVQVSH
jgi:hypothetical protein